jgi:hypothetical protein
VAVTSQQVAQPANDIVKAARALAPLIQESVSAMEEERRLRPQVVDALRELGAFRLAAPRAYGGLELDPMTQMRVVEELSRMDGSVGWYAMISSAGSFAGAFLAPAVAQRLCGAVDFSLAGQVVPADQVMSKAEALARQIAANGPVAVRKTKETVLRSLSVSFEEGFCIERENADYTMRPEDAKEGPRAFMEKRPPRYTGR